MKKVDTNSKWLLNLSKAGAKLDTNRWRTDIQSLLRSFASEDFQRREWGENRDTTVCFPAELFAQWFDDFFDKPEWIVQEGVLSKEEWEIIKPFHVDLKQVSKLYYKDKVDTKKGASILEYEPWLKVREKAKETLQELGWSKE